MNEIDTSVAPQLAEQTADPAGTIVAPAMLTYATPRDDPRLNLTRARVIVVILAALQVLLGCAFMSLLLWNLRQSSSWNTAGVVYLGVPFLIGMLIMACGLLMLFGRSFVGWRRTRVLLACESTASMLLYFGGLGMAFYFRNATGWDTLAVAFGLAIAILASIPFWLSVGSAAYLMRPAARMLFKVNLAAPFTARRRFIRVMWLTWILGAVATMLFLLVKSKI